jgi:hypothetical protein
MSSNTPRLTMPSAATSMACDWAPSREVTALEGVPLYILPCQE